MLNAECRKWSHNGMFALTLSEKGLQACFTFLPQPLHYSLLHHRASFWWRSQAGLGGWCTQSIWMLPFQLLYYWAISPALLLPFIWRQDLVKLFRMVLNSFNTKGEFSTFYHLSSASRVAGTSEMYHYAQQILCFKLFTVFETKIQKQNKKWMLPFMHFSQDAYTLTFRTVKSPCQSSPERQAQKWSGTDRESSFFPGFSVFTSVLLSAVPFYARCQRMLAFFSEKWKNHTTEKN